MGREWITWHELRIPEECPNCGGKTFLIEGSKKVYFEALCKDGEVVGFHEEETEWQVAYGIFCKRCEEDLSKLAGF